MELKIKEPKESKKAGKTSRSGGKSVNYWLIFLKKIKLN